MRHSENKTESFISVFSEYLVQKRVFITIFSLIFILGLSAGTPRLVTNAGFDFFFQEGDPTVALFNEIGEQYSSFENIMFLIQTKNNHLFNKKDINSLFALHDKAEQIPYNINVSSIKNYEYVDTDKDGLLINPLFDEKTPHNRDTLQKIKGKLINDDLITNFLINKQGSAAIVITEIGYQFDPSNPNHLKEVVSSARKIKQDIEVNNQDVKVHLYGTLFINNQAQEAISEIGTLVGPLIVAIMFFLLFYLFRSVGLVIAMLLIDVLTALGCIGAGAWLGVELNMLSTSAVSLALMVANMDTLHISTTYLNGLKNGLDRETSMSMSLQKNFKAILITTLTTIGGFFGFNFVGMDGMADLGNLAILGVAVAFTLSLTLFPTLAIKWSNQDTKRGVDQVKIAKGIGDFSMTYRRPLFVFFILLVVLIAPFAIQTPFNDDFSKYYDSDTDFALSMDAFAKEMGINQTIEYEIDSGIENGIYDPEFLRKVDDFVNWYKQQPNVTSVISFTNILKRINQQMHDNDPEWERIPDSSELASQYSLLYEFSADTEDLVKTDKSALHISVFLDVMEDKHFLTLDNDAHKWFASRYPEVGFQGTSFEIMYTKASESTVVGMRKGFAITLLFITLVMMISLRSIKYGLISLIPNLIPPLVIFGLWGLLVGEMGFHVASAYAISLGLVIDDTAHILVKYLEARKMGYCPERAAKESLENAAVAIILTTLIIGSGLLAFNASMQIPARDQGNVLAGIFFLALAFDLFVLPQLLIFTDNLFAKKQSHLESSKLFEDLT